MTIEAPPWKFFVRPTSMWNRPEYRRTSWSVKGRRNALKPNSRTNGRSNVRRSQIGAGADQSVMVSASKGGLGEPFGGLAVGFRLER